MSPPYRHTKFSRACPGRTLPNLAYPVRYPGSTKFSTEWDDGLTDLGYYGVGAEPRPDTKFKSYKAPESSARMALLEPLDSEIPAVDIRQVWYRQ
eukprot:SAG31_NODE_3804_length_3866_cov_3.183435_1_plen_94_part_10